MIDKPIIPNLDDYSPIINAAYNGKLVLFIGNGVSRLLGYPSWEEMANIALLRLFDEKKKVYHIDFLEKELLRKLPPKKQLSIIHDICNFKKIGLDYKNIITPDERKDKKVYDILYSINTPFVTTNYDDCLDRLAEAAKALTSYADSPVPVTASHPPLFKKVYHQTTELTTAKLDQGVVIHLHGSIQDPMKMIVSTRDYIRNYERGGFVDKFLEGLFEDRVILFIGYGLEEEEILEYIVGRGQKGTGAQNQKEAKHFCLYPKLSSENALFEHLKNYYINHCNVNLIAYEIDHKGHDMLEEIINNWAPQLSEAVKKRNYIAEQTDFKDLV